MRVILYTGKGGVGKTTVAAATAVKCADLGYRTLVISTDAAHSLGDSLDVAVGDHPTKVAKNLWAQEVNALHELENHWEHIHGYFSALFASQGVDDIVAEELSSPPGMEEAASLMWIKRHKADGKFDVIVVDCAPTGDTLQLLAFPDVAQWYLNKIFPLQRRVMKLTRPILQPLLSMPLPDDDIFAHIKDLLIDLEAMKQILADPKTCTVRMVLNLEKMVIKEAQRAYTYLSLYNYLTDCVVINRILPEEVHDTYFAAWRDAQGRYEEQVEAGFSPIPIMRSRLFSHEIVGIESLREMGNTLFEKHDPAKILYAQAPQQFRKLRNDYELAVQLPFASKEQVDITRREDELYVSVGPYKREISLPRILNGKPVKRAKLEDGKLSVVFSGGSK